MTHYAILFPKAWCMQQVPSNHKKNHIAVFSTAVGINVAVWLMLTVNWGKYRLVRLLLLLHPSFLFLVPDELANARFSHLCRCAQELSAYQCLWKGVARVTPKNNPDRHSCFFFSQIPTPLLFHECFEWVTGDWEEYTVTKLIADRGGRGEIEQDSPKKRSLTAL